VKRKPIQPKSESQHQFGVNSLFSILEYKAWWCDWWYLDLLKYKLSLSVENDVHIVFDSWIHRVLHIQSQVASQSHQWSRPVTGPKKRAICTLTLQLSKNAASITWWAIERVEQSNTPETRERTPKFTNMRLGYDEHSFLYLTSSMCWRALTVDSPPETTRGISQSTLHFYLVDVLQLLDRHIFGVIKSHVRWLFLMCAR
jgi:hypothetical protein